MRERPSIVAPKRLLLTDIQFVLQRRTKTITRAQETIATIALSKTSATSSIIPFKTEEEVIEMANSTEYGLSASIFTENVSKAHRVAASIDSGVLWINTWLLRDLRIPFGGMKSSGLGREGGFKSLEFEGSINKLSNEIPEPSRFTSHSNFNLPLITIRATVYCEF